MFGVSPVSPCHDKCCKVRFKPTVEVREVPDDGRGVSIKRRLFKKVTHQKAKWRRHSLLAVWKVALLAALFGVVVSQHTHTL